MIKKYITKVLLTSQLKEQIYKQLSKHAIESKDFDGLANYRVSETVFFTQGLNY